MQCLLQICRLAQSFDLLKKLLSLRICAAQIP